MSLPEVSCMIRETRLIIYMWNNDQVQTANNMGGQHVGPWGMCSSRMNWKIQPQCDHHHHSRSYQRMKHALKRGKENWRNLVIPELALGTPGTKDQKTTFRVTYLFTACSSEQNLTLSTAHTHNRRLGQGIPHFFFQQQSPSLDYSPEALRKKIPGLPTEFPLLWYLLTLILFHFWGSSSQMTGAHRHVF